MNMINILKLFLTKCGSKAPTTPQRCGCARKTFWGGVHVCFSLTALVLCVASFRSNRILGNGMGEVEPTLSRGLTDVGTLINHTAASFQVLLVDNSVPLKKEILHKVNMCGEEHTGVNSTIADADQLIEELEVQYQQTKLGIKNVLEKCKLTEECKMEDRLTNDLESFLAKEINNFELSSEDENRKNKIKDILESIKKDIETALETMTQQLNNINQDIQKISQQASGRLNTFVNYTLPNTTSQITGYTKYRFFPGLLISSLLLLPILLHLASSLPIYFGNPEGSCSQTTGTKLVMAGVHFTFLFSLVILGLVAALLGLGYTTHMVVCQDLSDISTSQVWNHIDEQLKLPRHSLKDMMEECNENKTLSTIITFDLLMREKVDEVFTHYTDEKIGDDLLISWKKFVELLNIPSLSNRIQVAKEKVPIYSTEIDDVISNLEATTDITQKITRKLENKGITSVDNCKDMILEIIDLRLLDIIENEIGHCHPISNAYNSTISSLCNTVIYPANALWTSALSCLLALLVCLVAGVKLTNLLLWDPDEDILVRNTIDNDVEMTETRINSNMEYRASRLSSGGAHDLHKHPPPPYSR